MNTRLDRFDNSDFQRGRSKIVEAVWIIVSMFILTSALPGNRMRITLLRLFGATIGEGVVIKPRVRVKFPWRLEIGDHSWIGEDVWVDNLAQVKIGSHVCVSQGTYLCTGSHDWSNEAFALQTKPIVIENGAWIGAMTKVAPGARVGKGAVLAMGSVAVGDLEEDMIWQGNPARSTGPRKYRETA
jgi:putative colanic acid biosynthesis acetyltransferase WcaF